ncbi:MAG TPA: tetratricopeptide repeat protein [Terriglobia bacterium]|nr:tetratricopeptide repeat protein [Terriglobia bacterium]
MRIAEKSRLRPQCIAAIFFLALALGVCPTGFAQAPPENSAGQSETENTPQAHLGAGYENLKNSRYEAAAREFQAALALDPKLVLQARFPLAVSLFELHQNDAARREFETVRRTVGNHPNLEYYLGRLDLSEDHVDAAIVELNQAAAKPPFPDTAYFLGSAYLKRHDLASAEKWLHQAAELAPHDAVVQYRLATLYNEAGRKADAQKAFALSERLRQHEVAVDKARLDCKQELDRGSLEEARPVCEQLDDPDDADELTMLGNIYGEHGDFEDALKPLRRAAELNPSSPQMQYNLAFDYARLNRFEEARGPLARAVQRWPDLFPLNALYGAVLYNLGEERPAYEALSHAHELNPQEPGVNDSLYRVTLSLAKKSLASELYSASQRYLAEASKLRPQEPEPHRLLAEIYDATGRQAEAAEERRQAEQLSRPDGGNPN